MTKQLYFVERLPLSGSQHCKEVHSVYLTTNKSIKVSVCHYTYVCACIYKYIYLCVKPVCVGPDHKLTEGKSSESQNVTFSCSLDYN